MNTIGGLEGRILRKYLKGQVIDEKDRCYLDRLANTGLVHYGFSITGLVHYGFSIREMKPTAKTTPLGYACIF